MSAEVLGRLAQALGWTGSGDEGQRFAKYLLPNPRFPQWGRVVTIIDGELARESDGELLMGLIEACNARGLFWQVRPVAYDPAGPCRGMVSDWDRLQWEASGPSPAIALACAMDKALRADR